LIDLRDCCGLELDPKYVDVIAQRWEALTGKQAHLERTGETFRDVASKELVPS
jgi:DNA modification methylase